MTILNKHLESNTFMVGHQVTLADITIACSLLDGFVHIMDKAYRDQFPNLVRWFQTCVSQPQFEKVLGSVTMLGGKGAPKKEAAPKESPKKEDKGKKGEGSPKNKGAPAEDTPEIAAIKKQIAAKKEELKAA